MSHDRHRVWVSLRLLVTDANMFVDNIDSRISVIGVITGLVSMSSGRRLR